MQTLLAMLAYAALFTIPWLYYQWKPTMDRFVYDVLHFVSLIVLQGERWAYVLAVVAALGVWSYLEQSMSSLVVRASMSALAGLAVLIWRASAEQ